MPRAPAYKFIQADVERALNEDIGSGDVTAALIPIDKRCKANIISRQNAVLAGRPWVEEILRQTDQSISAKWHFDDGETLTTDSIIVELSGPTRSVLTAERCMLNFLQTLSGTATISRRYADAVAGTGVTLLDTRKTIPGLRVAQKYAVRCGGCRNHRQGLFDAFLIKENHITAAGSVSAAIELARQHNSKLLLEVEVETLPQLAEAAAAKPDRILLDNFSIEQISQAMQTTDSIPLEASGGITLDNILAIAETGIDFISLGILTKDIQAIDLSLLLDDS